MPPIPTEVLHEIISYLAAPCQQAAMCAVSSRFNEITIPILYRDLTLGTVAGIIRCCKTLIRTAYSIPRQHHARSFVIAPRADESFPQSLELILLLEATLKELYYLEHLHLWLTSYDDSLFTVFPSLAFPCLRRFGCHQPVNSCALGLFLNRHPALTHLEIIPPWRFVDPATPRQPYVHLPSLQSYRGSHSYFFHISVAARGLAHAGFWDVPPTTNINALAAALAAATSPRITFSLSILWDGPKAALFPHLARHLPHLRSLEIGRFLRHAKSKSRLHKRTVPQIAGFLEQFKHLIVFNLHNGALTSDEANDRLLLRHDASADRAALVTWGAHCPSLMLCELRNGAVCRKVDGSF
ncbi:hypothetical protein C8R44DRAFT_885152 [Mycena epipterygia]|nr:hypothetical protein C8R44DRAFT_885152 [Mycena epipterygia]